MLLRHLLPVRNDVRLPSFHNKPRSVSKYDKSTWVGFFTNSFNVAILNGLIGAILP